VVVWGFILFDREVFMAKAYKDYTIDDLIRLDLSFLVKDRVEAVSKAQAEAFTYLVSTANSCKMDIKQWKLLEVFGDEGVNLMVTDRSEINKRLFSKMGEVKKVDASSGYGFSMLQERRDAIIKATRKDYTSEIRKAKSLIQELDEKYTTVISNANNYTRQIREAINRVSDLEEKKLKSLTDDSTFKVIESILVNKFWQFIGIDNQDRVLFATTEYVKQEEKNPAAGS
jgi:hypothetical protein